MNTVSDGSHTGNRISHRGLRRIAIISGLRLAWAVALLLLIPLRDIRPFSASADYNDARVLFLQGYLEVSQQRAEQGYRRSLISRPEWSTKFQLLEAEAMEWRGEYEDALRILAKYIKEENEQIDKYYLRRAK